MALIFGFDIGTTSIGFAVIEHSRESRTGTIKRMGARIFKEARDPRTKVPLNQERRAARLRRRQLRRRRERQREIHRLLNGAGLLPERDSDEWRELMASERNGTDPYALRSRAVDAANALSPHEVGRALYHLVGRRHFLAKAGEHTNDAGSDADKDEAPAQSEREHTLAELDRLGLTLGQWQSTMGPDQRRRGIHATRQRVQEEFDRIVEAQKRHHPALNQPDFTGALRHAAFFQRPVFWRRNTLGDCPLLPGEPLCPRGSWLSQQRRMLEKLNNLEVAGGNQRPLDDGERAAILKQLQCQASMTWGGVRKALAPLYKERGEPGAQKAITFNLEAGKEKGLMGNALEARLSAIFGQEWSSHPRRKEIRDAIHARLWNADYRERGQRVEIVSDEARKPARKKASLELERDFGLTGAQAGELAELTLASGWEPFSTRALELILPRLQEGTRMGAILNGPAFESWRNETFPKREQPTGNALDRLPSPADTMEQERLNTLRNPTVVRVQNELRKVTNNLIRKFGKPDLIRVELAREIGLSKRDRDERQAGMKRQEARRRTAGLDLAENGLSADSRNVEKWLLWEECGRQCPYTGKMIGFDDLFRTGLFQVEHIWPRHRCGDDSFRNKTLCHLTENTRKGDRIPAEYLDADRMSALRGRLDRRLRSRANPHGMGHGKVRKFLAMEIPEDFASRQLNDTGFAARTTVASLKRLWPDAGPNSPTTVEAVSGRVTAKLRRHWGLGHVLAEDGEKTREDHRHHAIDALVVACTHQGITQVLSRYWQAEWARRENAGIPSPWDGIVNHANAAAQKIIVSHRVRKKVSGPLHKGTVFGDTRVDEPGSGKKAYRLYVTRKPLEELTDTNFGDGDGRIRNIHAREKLTAWRNERGGNSKAAFASPPYPTRGRDGVRIRKVRIVKKQQSSLMTRASTGYADSGENHHIAIWRRPDQTVTCEVVSLAEAAARIARREPVVRRACEDDAVFLMSLSKGDAIRRRNRIFIVESVESDGRTGLVDHRDARSTPERMRRSASSLVGQGYEKLSIDPIGRIRPAND